MQPMNDETKSMTSRRYQALLEEFQQLALKPSRDTEQRFFAVQRNINAIRELMLRNNIVIEEKEEV